MIYPGSNKAAEINAAIDAVDGGTPVELELAEGYFYLETPIILKSGVTLVGQGPRTILVCTYTGDADDSENCVISCVGTVDTDLLNTTYSNIAAKGEKSVSLTSAGNLVAGSYFVSEGINEGEQGGPSDGTLSEISKVDSSYTSGLDISLAWPKHQTNTTGGITVKGVVPVVDAGVSNLSLLGNSIGTTASGIYIKYGLNIKVESIVAANFSRAAVDVSSSVGIEVQSFYSNGNNTCWMIFISVCDFSITGSNGKNGVNRIHSQGLPRAQLYLRNRCTSGRVYNNVFTGGYAGVFHAGGMNLVFDNLLIKNQEITQEIYNRAVAGGEYQNLGRWVLGLGSGHAPIPMSEFAFGCVYSNITVQDLIAPNVSGWNDSTPRRALAFYIHDTKAITACNLTVHNFNVNSPISGFMFSDTDGIVKNITAKGTPFGFCFENFNVFLDIAGMRFDAVRAENGNAPLPLSLNYDASSNAGPVIRDFHAANAFSFLSVGNSQVFDPYFRIYNLRTDGGIWDYVIMANNQTGIDFSVGDIVEIDSAYAGDEVRVVTPNTAGADYATRLAVVCGVNDDVNTGFILVAPLPQNRASVMASTGAIAYGDRVGYVATRKVQKEEGALQPLGKALTRKAAGSAGLITIGVVA